MALGKVIRDLHWASHFHGSEPNTRCAACGGRFLPLKIITELPLNYDACNQQTNSRISHLRARNLKAFNGSLIRSQGNIVWFLALRLSLKLHKQKNSLPFSWLCFFINAEFGLFSESDVETLAILDYLP